MSFTPFDVVLVPFPFAEVDDNKLQPAVVISRPELEETMGVLWVLMITSTRSPMLRGDVMVTELELAGLRAPSRVRTSKVNALAPVRVTQRLGRLAPEDAASVAAETAAWLAIP